MTKSPHYLAEFELLVMLAALRFGLVAVRPAGLAAVRATTGAIQKMTVELDDILSEAR